MSRSVRPALVRQAPGAIWLLTATWLVIAAAQAMAQVPCTAADAQPVDAALGQIASSLDPCGESAQIHAVLDTLRQCTRTYRICVDEGVLRNVFDRPAGGNSAQPRTITWNPTLRTTLEDACEGDTDTPVRRDPTASLLHELVHAADDCRGLDPGTHELEAVRIENIYRRSVGLCQRTGYGDDPLPPRARLACAPGHCACSSAQPPPVNDTRPATRLEQAALGKTDPSAHAADQRDALSGTASRD